MFRKALYSFLLCAAIGAAFVAGSWSHRQDTVTAAALHGRRILYYVDPMHPSYKSSKPGIAPDCNMPLEPVYADGGAPPDVAPAPGAARRILLDSAKQQLIGVRVGTVEHANGVERVRLFGRVAAEEPKTFKVNSGLDGYIKEVSLVTTGSRVRKDEWLLTFSAPEIRSPIQGYVATLESAERETRNGTPGSVQATYAKAGLEQYVDRLITLGMSRPQIDEITKTHVVPPNILVTAPADGFVIARNVTPGEKVPKGTELYRIADLRQLWVVADVPPRDADRVRPGMTAEISVAGRTLPARARVSGDVLPQFDPTTQSSKVRLEIDNAGFALRPDMFVDVHLLVPYESALTVPSDAIVASGLRATVFVEKTPGSFEPRDVQTGRRFGDRMEILHGLDAGERIVVSGTFMLDSETRMHTNDQSSH